MKRLTLIFLPVIDVISAILVYPSAWLLKQVRRIGVHRLPACRNALLRVGVFPIRDHYYEPKFDYRKIRQSVNPNRSLPGIDWNISKQLDVLTTLTFSQELTILPKNKPATLDFYLKNGAFESGDAEYWYQIIRSVKPRRIFEVGSGNSTLMAIRAIQMNVIEDPEYSCNHVCIEPYEMPWLEETGISVVRRRVEDLNAEFFSELTENDILFIDSSHIIRPKGDILFEYLELLPTLKKGVIVHIHDIFSPMDYPNQWLTKEVRLWNEQYLLEAFLTHNSSWMIIGALNYLHHSHYDKLKSVAPYLTPDREPGSFYIKKIA